MFAFDLEAGLGLLQVQELRDAVQQRRVVLVDDRLHTFMQFLAEEREQAWRLAHQGTEVRMARQVVAHAVSRTRQRLRRERHIADCVDVANGCGVRDVESLAGQPFEQEPDPTGVLAGRRGSDRGREFASVAAFEDGAQNL